MIELACLQLQSSRQGQRRRSAMSGHSVAPEQSGDVLMLQPVHARTPSVRESWSDRNAEPLAAHTAWQQILHCFTGSRGRHSCIDSRATLSRSVCSCRAENSRLRVSRRRQRAPMRDQGPPLGCRMPPCPPPYVSSTSITGPSRPIHTRRANSRPPAVDAVSAGLCLLKLPCTASPSHIAAYRAPRSFAHHGEPSAPLRALRCASRHSAGHAQLLCHR